MTARELLALGRLLAGCLELFAECFSSRPILEHFRAYCRGLLSDLPRKSVEPMALQCGTPVRTLQRFLRTSIRDQGRMRDLYQRRLAAWPQLAMSDESTASHPSMSSPPSTASSPPSAIPDDLGTIGLIDETSVAKKGDETPGVQRQYCGSLGKQENCIVTVHLGACLGGVKALVDSELFLPESWSNDRERCRAADIPDEMVYRSEWKIALELLDQSRANGLRFDTPLDRLLRIAFSRWNIEHLCRVGKSELGFSHFEGLSDASLIRQMTMCAILTGFLAEQTDRLREKNPEITLEQTRRALAQRCHVWQRNRRRTTDLQQTANIIAYHQQRHLAAKTARKKTMNTRQLAL